MVDQVNLPEEFTKNNRLIQQPVTDSWQRAFEVQGPHELLVATLDGEAELPCFLLPPQNVKNMEISWTRYLPSDVVHLYEDGRDKPEEAMKEYFKRTELVKNVMHKGIVVLRIFNVQLSDNGQYRCAFQNGSFYSDTVIELKVAALGSHPQIHMEVTKSRQLRLECKSEGWFPQPKVQWMDSEGREISAESETHTQDEGGLFHVTTSLLLREAPRKNLTCSVWNPVLNQKKEEQLSIADFRHFSQQKLFEILLHLMAEAVVEVVQ
ncbi:selection and upkeep of intraepithelial T-cells protein 1-like [Myotis lucifugus]|uniref:selection and upkeep of intraepithelial T-cells protein 1-like n=1 Tax=Myotis lucifugus TaxID=59463 RepID=UPI0003C4BDDD|nr:selection and upkeep of intraepithelial T-cells protein 1-like [Myotis lucifugus]